MNKKILIQIFLFFVVVVALWAYYYFYTNTKVNNKADNNIDTKIIITDDSANVIENIFYTSTDSFGNKFEINAKTGKIKLDNQDIVYMNNVFAVILSNALKFTIVSVVSIFFFFFDFI